MKDDGLAMQEGVDGVGLQFQQFFLGYEAGSRIGVLGKAAVVCFRYEPERQASVRPHLFQASTGYFREKYYCCVLFC